MRYLNPWLKWNYFRFRKTDGRHIEILVPISILTYICIVIGMSFYIFLPNLVVIDDREILPGCQQMANDVPTTKLHRNIAENFNRLSKVHERFYRQTTYGRTTTYSTIARSLITDRKSHASFRLVPNSMTLNDLERCNSPHN